MFLLTYNAGYLNGLDSAVPETIFCIQGQTSSSTKQNGDDLEAKTKPEN